jgi:hypothetical protein
MVPYVKGCRHELVLLVQDLAYGPEVVPRVRALTRGWKARGAKEAGEALGTPWMTLAECAQAIPPAYTEHVGGYLMAAVRGQDREAA